MIVQWRYIIVRSSSHAFLAVAVASLLGCSRVDSVNNSAGNQSVQSASPTDRDDAAAVKEKIAPIQISVDEPSTSEPVKAAMEIRPGIAVPGDAILAVVNVRIAPATYLHTADGPASPFTPLEIKLTLPEGVEPVGDWQLPEPTKVHGVSVGYRDSILVKRELKILPNANKQAVVIIADVQYQACTDEMCWPPKNMKLTASLLIGSRSK